jgi:NAD(P)-dependent dehydrogenase (short-subunit alcohol dehydrogenase family)
MSDGAFNLAGRVAVVTGAVGLLGRHHCRALQRAGARVVVSDLDADACARFAAELDREGVEALPLALDVTSAESLERAKATIVSRCGRLDVLVNNAAINDMVESPEVPAELARFERYPLELWNRSLSVGLTGTFLCCQKLGALMAERGGGSIINIASTYGIVAPDQALYRKPDGSQAFWKTPAYPVVKSAVIGLTRFVAAYWGRQGVRVNCISPGGVENGQEEWFSSAYAQRTPLGRMARPGDLAGALVFLASDASTYVTGANVVVDGGWTIW